MTTTQKRQAAFDRAAAHLISTGRPSGDLKEDGYFDCLYSGSGCALRPFIPEDQDPRAWDTQGGIMDIEADLLPLEIAADIEFFSDLQGAHDDSAVDAKGDVKRWRTMWIDCMVNLAAHYGLNDEAVRTKAA